MSAGSLSCSLSSASRSSGYWSPSIGIQAGVDHRLDVAVAGQRLGRAVLRERDRVADLHERRVLQAGDEVADLADAELVDRASRPAGARRPPRRRSTVCVAIRRTFMPLRIAPSMTRMSATTPRYASK